MLKKRDVAQAEYYPELMGDILFNDKSWKASISSGKNEIVRVLNGRFRQRSFSFSGFTTSE